MALQGKRILLTGGAGFIGTTLARRLVADNEVVAMTGAQPTLLPSSRLQPLVVGLGVDPAHCRVIDAHPKRKAENAAVIRRELEHRGLSVVIAARPCIEAAKARKVAARQPEAATVGGGAPFKQ